VTAPVPPARETEPDGYLPRGVPVTPYPRRTLEGRPAPRWRRPDGQRDDLGEPTAVFLPDTRYAFTDTAFPWRTCGRVATPGGSASGVMIGPRHMMTASHIVPWLGDGGSDWITFTPLQYDTSEPFGSAYATRVYYWRQGSDADGIDSQEAAFDYVVCVLNTRLGESVGWMGSRTYSDDWNGQAVWGHVGYPFDIGSASRPVYHGDGIMDSTVPESLGGHDAVRVVHRNDAVDGQSGGPYFGWWEGEEWPRVVATQSAENWGGTGGPNAAGGGAALPILINHARAVEP
jgi:V8-like Glu-specific endopeptidase